jgi:cation transport regulator
MAEVPGFAELQPTELSTEPLRTGLTVRLVGRTEWVSILGQATKGDEIPYKQITQLPDNVKNNLPKGAQEIYKEAFNSAEEQYGEEDRAHRVAWSAVEQKYEKNE